MIKKNVEIPQGEILLRIDGTAYYGWKEVKVTKSMNSIAGAFELVTSDRYPNKPENWDLRVGSRCTIELENQTLITGYIDDISMSYDYQGHSVSISGRDNTCDLVDCNYPKETSWINQTLTKIVTDVCDLFDIKIYIDPKVVSICNATLPTGKVTIQCADTVFDFITKICKAKAVLPICYGDGKLTITRAGGNGTCIAPIQLGYNILNGNITYSNKDRFSHYLVKGQSSGKTTLNSLEDLTSPSNTEQFLLSKDDSMKRYRPKVLTYDGNATTDTCKKYGDWFRNVTAGNSRTLNYELVEWIQGPTENGIRPIWDINKIVTVKDPTFGIESSFLISSVEYTCNNSEGTLVKLTLVYPETYSPEPFTFEQDTSKIRYDSINELKNAIMPLDQDRTTTKYNTFVEEGLDD
jgi:prophage tail gpP-like protein